MKRKILICGASGFIGRNLAEHFLAEREFEVFGTFLNSPSWSAPNFQMVRADLTRKEDVERVVSGMDIIIQAAATTSGAKEIVTKPYYHVTDNAVMNSLIFRAAFEQQVSQVIFFSCTVMYPSSEAPLKETDFDANNPIYPNYFGVGWTKVYIEKLCEFYSRIGDAKYTVLRHSNIYGPYDKFDPERSHVFGATIHKVMNAGEGGTLSVWGSGEEARDLLYISDLVSAVNLAVKKQESEFEIFNVGCGCSISVKDLVGKIITSSGKKLSIAFDLSKPTLKTKLCLDSSKIKNALGWQPQVPLDEGIRKTMKWYADNVGILSQERR